MGKYGIFTANILVKQILNSTMPLLMMLIKMVRIVFFFFFFFFRSLVIQTGYRIRNIK
jgi:hypothetical protein